MPDISDTFNFEGIMEEVDAPEEFQPFMERLLHRLDLFRVDLLNQLNNNDGDEAYQEFVRSLTSRTITANTTLLPSDGTIYIDTTQNDVDLTLLEVDSIAKLSFNIKKIKGANTARVLVASGDYIDSSSDPFTLILDEVITIEGDSVKDWKII